MAKLTRRPPWACSLARSGAFAMAEDPSGTVRVTSKGVLNDGSSKQGKAFRAASGSICVKA
ncbi:MAG: hypothetical protein M5U28_00970 [Sandaracinaceae bacterium]|nr:hypothetical protein [Sandaracinaceae bacterium]